MYFTYINCINNIIIQQLNDIGDKINEDNSYDDILTSIVIYMQLFRFYLFFASNCCTLVLRPQLRNTILIITTTMAKTPIPLIMTITTTLIITIATTLTITTTMDTNPHQIYIIT